MQLQSLILICKFINNRDIIWSMAERINAMKYQISYLSPSGNCGKLADAFADILEDVYLADLQYDSDVQGDIILVGFEINESRFKTIPYEVMEILDQLEEKTVLLFATCPFEADQSTVDQLEQAVLPFLPDNCDYRGFFVCAGQASQQLVSHLQELSAKYPQDQRTRALLQSCMAAAGHPDEDDIMKACLFVTKELDLE